MGHVEGVECKMCPHCGTEREDALHMWWRCPAFEPLREKAWVGRSRPDPDTLPPILARCGVAPGLVWREGGT
eukprot:7549491-Alexandrium_andersonii.AAC.1